MKFNLKSIKVLHVLPNGCVYFDHSTYLKTHTKYSFLKKSLLWNPFDKKKLVSKNSNFFYKKYRTTFKSDPSIFKESPAE